MRISYANVIEQNAGWGAECFVNEALRRLGHDTFTIDYRAHRHELSQKFRELPDFDAFLLQRGEWFPFEILAAIERPRFFWASELVSRRRDQDRLLQSGLFSHVFLHTCECKRIVTENGWLKPENCSVILNGFNEALHRIIPDTPKDLDVVFIGGLNARRRGILDRISKSFRVTEAQVFGKDFVKLLNRAKIVLNIHAEDFLDTETRVFEALGSGAFLLSEKLGEENPFQPGVHYAEAATIDELEEKIAHYLSRDEARTMIASQGHAEAQAKHSYSARAAQIVATMQPFVKDTANKTQPIRNDEIAHEIVSADRRPWNPRRVIPQLAVATYTHSRCFEMLPIYIYRLRRFLGQTRHYFFANEKTGFPDTILYPDLHYTRDYLACLRKVREAFVLYMQEDFVLYDYADLDALERVTTLLSEGEFSFVRLIKSGDLGEKHFRDDLYEIPQESPNLFAMQATIWRKDRLEQLYSNSYFPRIGDEPHFSGVCRKLGLRGLYIYRDEPKRGKNHFDSSVFPYIATAKVKGHWNSAEYPAEIAGIAEDSIQLLLDAYQRGEHESAVMRLVSLAPILDADTIVSLAEKMANLSFSPPLANLLSVLATQLGEGNLELLKRVLDLLKKAETGTSQRGK